MGDLRKWILLDNKTAALLEIRILYVAGNGAMHNIPIRGCGYKIDFYSPVRSYVHVFPDL